MSGMAKPGLNRSQVLEAFDVEELGVLLEVRKEIEALQEERKEAERRLAEITGKIDALASGRGRMRGGRGRRPGRRGPPIGRGPRSTGAAPATGERLPDLAVRILADAGEPMRVKDLASAALREGYVTRSGDFSRVVRILVYKEPRIKKVGRGLFTVTAGAARAGKQTAAPKGRKTGRKTTGKTTRKKTVKKAAAKKKTTGKKAPKKTTRRRKSTKKKASKKKS
jgi:hypothetical protein